MAMFVAENAATFTTNTMEIGGRKKRVKGDARYNRLRRLSIFEPSLTGDWSI
jgi:hypothetical protein